MLNFNDEEEYEFSMCAEEAIDFYWPDHLQPGTKMFEKRMLELQLALIECKLPIMYPSDKRRALSTIREIKQKMKEVG